MILISCVTCCWCHREPLCTLPQDKARKLSIILQFVYKIMTCFLENWIGVRLSEKGPLVALRLIAGLISAAKMSREWLIHIIHRCRKPLHSFALHESQVQPQVRGSRH